MAEFKPDKAGLREFLRSADLYPALDTFAGPIESRAKSNATVESAESASARNRAPGQFRDSIHRERHRSPSRVTIRVVADSDAANIIENRDRPLGRAAG